MSRFFRSGHSSTSSDDDDDDENIQPLTEGISVRTSDDSTVDLANAGALMSLAGNHPPQSAGRVNHASEHWTSRPKDTLLHALLEERCFNDTLKLHDPSEWDSPQVKAEAQERYRHLVSQLASSNVLPSGLEQDEYATTRQRYREGLDALSRQNRNNAVPSGPGRMLMDGNFNAIQHNAPLPGQLMPSVAFNQPTLSAPLQRLLGYSEPANTRNDGSTAVASTQLPAILQPNSTQNPLHSRYQNDFEELSILGHGGYGIVYRARHRLDNRAYAVKKVSISEARLRRMRTRGQAELDEILLELRTLARLQHPNIVRYFNAWVDWALPPSHADKTVSGLDNSVSGYVGGQASASAKEQTGRSLGRVFSEEEVDGTEVVFEDSGTLETSDAHHSADAGEGFQLRRRGTRSALATVSDETVESIDRVPEPSTSIQSTAEGAYFAQPTFAIHLQMSLHPFTLADLLQSKGGEGETAMHCYHIGPSVGIVNAVLEGVQYLHGEGVVHRDIKPANIFLSPANNRTHNQGCVDLRRCDDCGDNSGASGNEVDVCIGDFGLATVADHTVDGSSSSPVGTAIYRPTAAESTNHSLDIYALGIVLFELLWKFDTRMERHHILHELKEGTYPDDFRERVGRGRGERTMECIDRMLARGDQVISIPELKEKLHAIVSSTES